MSRKFSAVSILLICLAGFGVYANALPGIFVFDDHSFIENNPVIYNIFNFEEITRFHPSRPFGTYTFAFDYAIWQLNPLGYHLTNLIIHLAASVMVWWLVAMIAGVKSNRWLPLVAAVIFAVHPVHTEAVNYITQRYTVLAGFLYLASVCLYVRGRQDIGNWKFYSASLVCAFLGALTRETLATLPLVIGLTEFFFLRKKFSSKSTWPYFFLLIAALAVIPLMHSFDIASVWAEKGYSHSHEAERITAGNYLLTQIRVLVVYLGLFLFPLQQNFEYDFAVSHSFLEPAVLVCFGVLSVLVFLAFLVRKKMPLVSFGIFWFFVTVSVEGGLIPIPYVINEYRTYLPSVGYCIAVSTLLTALIKSKRSVAVISGVLIAVYALMTFERNKIWQDEIVFWQDVVSKSPKKSRPRDNLGQALMADGQYEAALHHLKLSRTLNPRPNAATLTNIGLAYMNLGEYEESRWHFDEALRVVPGYSWALNNRGVVLLKLGHEDLAKVNFKEAIASPVQFLEPYLNLAGIYGQQSDIDNAEKLYRKALKLYPHHGHAYVELLKILFDRNDMEEAAVFMKFMSDAVSDPEYLTAAGSLIASRHLSEPALAFFSKALEQPSAGRSTYIELGKYYANHNKFSEAVQVWEEGSRKFPGPEFRKLIEKAKAIESGLVP